MKSDYEKPEITTIIMDNEISLTTISAPDDPEKFNNTDSFDWGDPFMEE